MIVLASLLVLAMLGLSIGLAVDMIRDRKMNKDSTTGVIVTFTAFLLFATLVTLVAIKGPTTQYQAVIHDFNEVAEQGYEIVDQKEEIYILEKIEED